MNIQAPPNLSPDALTQLVQAGINDWGGISPVTPDHVNPEVPWPQIDRLAATTSIAGKDLVERLAIYPAYARASRRWIDDKFRPALLRQIDGEGLPRTESWSPGGLEDLPAKEVELIAGNIASISTDNTKLYGILARAQTGARLDEDDIVQMLAARGNDFAAVCRAADELRRATNGDTVSYIVTRNGTVRNSVREARCRH